MKKTGNIFYDALIEKEQKNFKILFKSQNFWSQSREDFDRQQKFNKKLKEELLYKDLLHSNIRAQTIRYSDKVNEFHKEYYAYELQINDNKKEFVAQLNEFTGGAVQSDDVAFVIAKRG